MLSSTPLVVGRNAHTEAFFQLTAKGAPNKIVSFYFSVPVHQVRHDVLEGEQVARVLLCSCFDSDRYDLNKSESNCLRVRDNENKINKTWRT